VYETSIIYVTHSHVTNDVFIRDTIIHMWLIHMCLVRMWLIQKTYVTNDSSICNVTHSQVTNATFMFVTWLMHASNKYSSWNMTHSSMCVKWFMHAYGTHARVWHTIIYSYKKCRRRVDLFVTYEAFACVTRLVYKCEILLYTHQESAGKEQSANTTTCHAFEVRMHS